MAYSSKSQSYIIVFVCLVFFCLFTFYTKRSRVAVQKKSLIIHRKLREKSHSLPLFNLEERVCSKLLTKNNNEIKQDLSRYFEEVKKHTDLQNFKGIQGYSAQLIDEVAVQYYLAQLPHVKTVCETGFNGGHSTLLWLTANPNVKVYSFDIGIIKQTRPAAERLKKKYGSRFNITWGDSTKTLSTFAKQNPDVRCDLIIIDGGHSYDVAKSDFVLFKQMASDKHIVFLDDYPCKPYFCEPVGKMWTEKIKQKEVVELASCSVENNNRGFSFGQYLFWV